MHDIAFPSIVMSFKTPATNKRISRIRSLRLVIITFSIASLVASLCFPAREAHGQAKQITELIERLKLSENLTSPDLEARRKATDALGRVGAEANEIIRRLTAETTANNKDDDARLNAARELGQVKAKVRDAVSALMAALDDKTNDQFLRYGVAYALGEMGSEAGEAAPNLIRTLEDKIALVRGAAAIALGKIRADAKVVVPALTAVLEDDDPNVRGDVLFALGLFGEEARDAVPAIKAKLKDVVPVCLRAASALGDIGPAANGAVSELVEALRNAEDQSLRLYAASALGKIGTEDAIAALINALSDTNKDVCGNAALALGAIGTKAKEGVATLLVVLKHGDERSRSAAAIALGMIAVEAPEAKEVVPKLITALKRIDETPGVRKDVVGALCSIAEAVSVAGSKEMLPELEDAYKAVKEHRDPKVKARAGVIKRDVDRLERLQPRGWIEKISQLMQDYLITTGVVVFMLTLSYLLLFRPLSLLGIINFIGSIPLPKIGQLPAGTLSHYILFPRVLDKLVQQIASEFKKHLVRKMGEKECHIHVATPAKLDNKEWNDLSIGRLQPIFRGKTIKILIMGVGGVGKTSLAYQMALWGTEEEPEKRLCKEHRMLPVFIEGNLEQRKDGKDAFIEELRRQLAAVIRDTGGPQTISAEVVKRFLQERRVLVIVDGFSELDAGTRKNIFPQHDDYTVNALIITSRSGKTGMDKPGAKIELDPLNGDELSDFMEGYLEKRNMSHLFTNEKYFGEHGRLLKIVGDRKITAKIAKMYVERIIEASSGQEQSSGHELLCNLPDLMVQYISDLNEKVPQVNKKETPDMQRAAKIIAWEYVKQSFDSSTSRKEVTKAKVLDTLGRERGAVELLSYLEDHLRIIETTGPGKDKIRFLLDPLAEYLAAMHLIDQHKNHKDDLKGFVNDHQDSLELETIKYFLLALSDCCKHYEEGRGVPEEYLRKTIHRMAESASANPSSHSE